MAKRMHAAHEPLIHISKRDECGLLQASLIRLAALVLALVVCALVIVALTGLNPGEVYESLLDGALGYKNLFKQVGAAAEKGESALGAFGAGLLKDKRLWSTVRDTLSLLLVAVAITPAFRMRFWNVGGEGQILVGTIATAAVMINLSGTLPAWALFALMILAAMGAGLVWGVIPALFKAQWNTNETLFTLMMNYVATQLTAFCIVYWENPAGSNSVGLINMKTRAGWLPRLFGLEYGWNLVIVLTLMALMYVYLRYSKQGYEIAYVGQSVNTARYAGISVKRVIIRTMAISGALCGLTGFLLVSGSGHTVSTELSGGRGFTAIVVAWLSKLNTFTMLGVSFLLTVMSYGASQIASDFGLNHNASEILTGIILFFVLGCEFFISYKVSFRHHRREE